MSFLVTDNQNGAGIGRKLPSDAITEPGCYVCLWSGDLLRIAANNYPVGCAPVISIVGGRRMFVTKISDNPYITLTEAQELSTRLANCKLSMPETAKPKRSSSRTGQRKKSARIRKVAAKKAAPKRADRKKTTKKTATRSTGKTKKSRATSKQKAEKNKGRR